LLERSTFRQGYQESDDLPEFLVLGSGVGSTSTVTDDSAE